MPMEVRGGSAGGDVCPAAAAVRDDGGTVGWSAAVVGPLNLGASAPPAREASLPSGAIVPGAIVGPSKSTAPQTGQRPLTAGAALPQRGQAIGS